MRMSCRSWKNWRRMRLRNWKGWKGWLRNGTDGMLSLLENVSNDKIAAQMRREERGTKMTVHGRIKNGRVLLDNPRALAEGTEVEVRRVKNRKLETKPHKAKATVR